MTSETTYPLDDWKNTTDWDEDGYCDLCGGRAEWPPTGEPAFAVCVENERHQKRIKEMLNA